MSNARFSSILALVAGMMVSADPTTRTVWGADRMTVMDETPQKRQTRDERMEALMKAEEKRSRRRQRNLKNEGKKV